MRQYPGRTAVEAIMSFSSVNPPAASAWGRRSVSRCASSRRLTGTAGSSAADTRTLRRAADGDVAGTRGVETLCARGLLAVAVDPDPVEGERSDRLSHQRYGRVQQTALEPGESAVVDPGGPTPGAFVVSLLAFPGDLD